MKQLLGKLNPFSKEKRETESVFSPEELEILNYYLKPKGVKLFEVFVKSNRKAIQIYDYQVHDSRIHEINESLTFEESKPNVIKFYYILNKFNIEGNYYDNGTSEDQDHLYLEKITPKYV
jgi:hypothetical protein